MPAAVRSMPVPFGAITIHHAVVRVERALEYVTRVRRAARTARELSRLSDHQLDDIGLGRGEIRDVAAGLARLR